MKKRIKLIAITAVFAVGILATTTIVSKVASENEINDLAAQNDNQNSNNEEGAYMSNNKFPAQLKPIPRDFFQESNHPGQLVDLNYQTYESFTYDSKRQVLNKRAVVYLPHGSSQQKQYNVFYLMHGGWSNETTILGAPGRPNDFKNIVDNAMAAGLIEPMIIVCPTYNNTSPTDSGDYSLALKLTDNYHQELINDLLPAVESKYHTFAQDISIKGLEASRDHRAFCGFSMGSVATWRTFEHCLDYFRYFMPSSGGLTGNGNYMASIVSGSHHNWDDFFIFAATGTADFAYSSFHNQIEAMRREPTNTFRFANNENDGNLYYLEKPGGTHSGPEAMEYFYNGLLWIWKN